MMLGCSCIHVHVHVDRTLGSIKVVAVLCWLYSSVPEDFDYNPHTGKHGDRSQRMEIKRSSVEYVAPSEYMVSV